MREIHRILNNVEEKENRVVFSKVAEKGNLCMIGVIDASYCQEDQSLAGKNLTHFRRSVIFFTFFLLCSLCSIMQCITSM